MTKGKSLKRHFELSHVRADFWPIIVVFFWAIFVRGLYLYESRDSPTFKIPVVDARTYDQIARQIVDRGEFTRDLFWQPPFYPFFLASIYKVTKGSILGAKIFQMILGSITCVFVFLLGAKILNRKSGLLAGLIAASYLPLIFFEGELLAAGWAAFWSIVLVFGFLNAAEKPTLSNALILGLLGVLSIITRPEFLPFFAAGLIWLFIADLKQRGLKKSFLGALLVTAGFLMAAVPIAILGYSTTGQFRILPFSGGVNLYIGNNPDYKNTIAIRPGFAWEMLLETPARYGIEDIQEKEKFFRRQAIRYAFNEPLSFTKGLIYKTAQWLSSREIARNVDMYSFRPWSRLLRFGVWRLHGFGFPFGILLPLAVIGAVFWRRKIPMPMWLYLVFYPISVILIFAASRYRVPIVPILSVLAAGGCAAVYDFFKRRRWRTLIVVLCVFLIMAYTSSALGPFKIERLNYPAEIRFFLGVALEERGQTEEAKISYREAIQLRPDYADAYYNLGVIMERQKKPNEAWQYYLQAIQADPNYSHAYYNLAVMLQSRGRLDEAIKYYEEAVRINPFDAFAHNNLGIALISKKHIPEAIKHYRLALQYKPKYSAAHNNLGYALLGQGQVDEAAEHFRNAIVIDPSFVAALSGLARIYVTHPKPQRRDPQKAIILAEEAARLTAYGNPRILNILVMSYASAGSIELAVKTAKKALELATAANDLDLAAQIELQLASFKKTK